VEKEVAQQLLASLAIKRAKAHACVDRKAINLGGPRTLGAAREARVVVGEPQSLLRAAARVDLAGRRE
jgi:hypothetical protein